MGGKIVRKYRVYEKLLIDRVRVFALGNGRLLPFGWAKFLYYRRRILGSALS